MVSNNGFFDLHIEIIFLNSGDENSSSSSKLNLGGVGRFSGKTLTLPILFAPDFATRNSEARSAVVTTELSLFIGNNTYTELNSRSSSALSGEKRAPIWRVLELTRNVLGDSNMSSAALVGWFSFLISPSG
ncbi:hypothetical protein Hanom_Chr04g00341841 [Helianthus anomalus]